jgi:hypothetical protein
VRSRPKTRPGDYDDYKILDHQLLHEINQAAEAVELTPPFPKITRPREGVTAADFVGGLATVPRTAAPAWQAAMDLLEGEGGQRSAEPPPELRAWRAEVAAARQVASTEQLQHLVQQLEAPVPTPVQGGEAAGTGGLLSEFSAALATAGDGELEAMAQLLWSD